MAASATVPSTTFLLLLFSLLLGLTSAQLSANFYSKTCPNALSIIQTAVANAVKSEARMGASLLRLHFHDCFVNGCDASILLDDTANFTGEQFAGPNVNSIRGLNVIDNIKTQLEKSCVGVVSCADIVAVAARDSVVALGGPSWNLLLGRRDSTTASQSAANSLPGPGLSLSQLISTFSNKGFSAREMVALSGSHTIGQARCSLFRSRIYNEKNINASFATSLQANCPQSGGDSNLAALDTTTPTSFDNAYFKNLQSQKGLLHSDQQLFNGGSTDSIVNTYSSNPSTFATDFANAMLKMNRLQFHGFKGGAISTILIGFVRLFLEKDLRERKRRRKDCEIPRKKRISFFRGIFERMASRPVVQHQNRGVKEHGGRGKEPPGTWGYWQYVYPLREGLKASTQQLPQGSPPSQGVFVHNYWLMHKLQQLTRTELKCIGAVNVDGVAAANGDLQLRESLLGELKVKETWRQREGNRRVIGILLLAMHQAASAADKNRAACGLNIKLPKEKIEDIDAGDVYNELAVVEYAEDIYKLYKEAEDPEEADKLLKIQRELDETKFFLVSNVLTFAKYLEDTDLKLPGSGYYDTPNLLGTRKLTELMNVGEKLDSSVEKSSDLSATSQFRKGFSKS
nr:cationic peroxidase 1-like [Ipomoea batatas]